MTRRPRDRHSRADAVPFHDHRLDQILSAARRTLALALEDAADPTLSHAALLDVVPHPDASCLRLVVSVPDEALADAVQGALVRARGYLRAELAADLDRRRTPELVFTVVAGEEPA